MAGGRRKQRYATANLDPSWNLQEVHDNDSASTKRSVDGNESSTRSQRRSQEPVGTNSTHGPSTYANDNTRLGAELSSHRQSLPTTRGSTPSRQSRDDGESLSTISSSAPSRSTKSRKKRYATQHSAEWLEEGHPSVSIVPASAAQHQPLHGLPSGPQPIQPLAAQPQKAQTPSSAGASTPSGLSIFRIAKHSQHSPGQDAPAIHPGAPSTYQAALSSNTDQPRSQTQTETTNENALSAINEECTVTEPPVPLQPASTKISTRKRLSRLLHRSK